MAHFYHALSDVTQQMSCSVLWRNLLLFLLWLAVWMLGLLVEYTEHANALFALAVARLPGTRLNLALSRYFHLSRQ